MELLRFAVLTRQLTCSHFLEERQKLVVHGRLPAVAPLEEYWTLPLIFPVITYTLSLVLHLALMRPQT
jgi:hypothetical protein